MKMETVKREQMAKSKIQEWNNRELNCQIKDNTATIILKPKARLTTVFLLAHSIHKSCYPERRVRRFLFSAWYTIRVIAQRIKKKNSFSVLCSSHESKES